jgi:hypothetical protein
VCNGPGIAGDVAGDAAVNNGPDMTAVAAAGWATVEDPCRARWRQRRRTSWGCIPERLEDFPSDPGGSRLAHGQQFAPETAPTGC